MATKLQTKKFTSQFERWVGAPPAGCRFLFNDAVTGKPYWITREDFLNGFNGTSDSGASAYQIYAATTSDNPVLSEIDWIYSLHGHDGITPTIGSNGHWFIGTVDTGIKAEPENPIPAAQIYNAPMGAVIFFVGLLSSLSDSWHLANGDVVEGFGATIDMRGKVPMGYDPDSFATPIVATGLVKNYGAIGNTGGKSWYKLTGKQSGVADHDHDVPASTGTVDGTGSQQGIKPPGSTKIKTSIAVAKDALEDHENRMEYVVGAYIQRVKPEVLSGGGNMVYQKKATITTTDGVMNESTYVVEGTSEFLLPIDFDYDHDYTFFNGPLMTEPELNRVTRMAKFTPVPLEINKITIKYYPL